jgi:hypothetical protein
VEPEYFYFVFHHRPTIAQIRAGQATWTQYFGHVEAMGYTIDDTWFFYDPGRYRSSLSITHIYDEVEEIMAEKFSRAHTVIKVQASKKFLFPLHLPMNCVTQCAALVGIRAFTPNGFRKRLLQEKGVIVHGPQGRSRSEKRPRTAAPPVGS